MGYVESLAAASKVAFPRRSENAQRIIEFPAGSGFVSEWVSIGEFGGGGRLFERIGEGYWELEFIGTKRDRFELAAREIHGEAFAGCRGLIECDWIEPNLISFTDLAPEFIAAVTNQVWGGNPAHMHTLHVANTLRVLAMAVSE